MTTGPEPTRVAYVGGTGRSGSTVLANVLGELQGFVSVGEVRFLWQRGIVQDRLCGCGAHVTRCPFWGEVLDRTLGPGSAGSRIALATRLHGELEARTRLRTLPRHLRGSAAPAGRDHLSEVLARLYPSIAAVAAADVVVDSSKLPTYAALLRDVDGLDVRVAHLVRDPRAAAYSWRRRKRQPDLGAGAYMERRGAAKSALLWTVWNRGLEAMGAGRPHGYARITYEQLLLDPRPELGRLLAALDLPGDLDQVFTGPREVRLTANHTVAGNPSRHQQGVVALVPDDEWRTRMRATDRGVVATLAWPGLRRYGYRVRS